MGRVPAKKLAALSKEGAGRNMCSMVTYVSYYVVSSSGKTYVITWGTIIFGVIQILQGLSQYKRQSSSRDKSAYPTWFQTKSHPCEEKT